jgi:hypothetical protein
MMDSLAYKYSDNVRMTLKVNPHTMNYGSMIKGMRG